MNQEGEIVNIIAGKRSKTIDAVCGLAIADAVGVPVEFKNRLTLKDNPVTDMIGYGTHKQPAGTWSDDTSMTLATMDSINKCGEIDYEDIMKRFADWVNYAKYTATGVFFDIGIVTRNAIERYLKGYDAIRCGESGIRSNGNGSLMRIIPIVLYSYYKDLDEEAEIVLINNVSSLTHAHEISRLGCKIYSDYVKSILNGQSREEAFYGLYIENYRSHYSEDSIEYYRRILDGSLMESEEDDIRSSGFIVNTLEASLWCILNSADYKEAVLKAVNLGADTDTVGAVTGSIAGILYGYDNIPENWRDGLISREYLLEICRKFDGVMSQDR